MEIPRQLVPLTDAEERELTTYILNELLVRGKNSSRYPMYSKCYDAYNQVWRDQLPKEWSWIQNIALYMQTMTQVVNTGAVALSNYLFPNENDYMDIDDEDTGEYWKSYIMLSNEKTGFVHKSHQGILQAGITGDNATEVVPKGPFMSCNSIPVSEIYFYPLTEDLTETSKIRKIRKTEYALRNSTIQYFNLEKLRDIPWWKYDDPIIGTINPHNPVKGDDQTALGQGFLLYQAYINYFKFTTGAKREITNFIATVCNVPRVLVRFEKQGSYDWCVWNNWETMPTGGFFGKGLVEPNLNPLSYMNTMETLSLVDKFLRTLQVYTYDFTDEIAKLSVLKRKMLLQPGALIARTRENSFTPLQRDPAPKNEAREHNLFWKNEIQETTGMTAMLSGSQEGTPDPTATSTGYRAQGAQGRVAKIARHWDETYMKECAYRQIKGHQEMLQKIPVVNDQGQTIGYRPGQNLELMVQMMEAFGWDYNKKIVPLMQNQKFLSKIFKPVELNKIKPTGSTSVSNRLNMLNNFNQAITLISQTPGVNYLKWDKITEDQLRAIDMPNVEDKMTTKEQQLRDGMQQIMLTLQGGVDTNPTLPDGQPNPNAGQALMPNQRAGLMQQYQQMQAEYQSETSPEEADPNLIYQMMNMNNGMTGAIDQTPMPYPEDVMDAQYSEIMPTLPYTGNEQTQDGSIPFNGGGYAYNNGGAANGQNELPTQIINQ